MSLFVPMVAVNALAAYHIFAMQNGGDSIMSDNGTLLGQLIILLTTLATLGYQVYARRLDSHEKERQRLWDLEDRRIAREEQMRQTKEVKEAIDVNTQITAVAANNAALSERRLAELRAMFEQDAAIPLEKIEDNTTETVERLRRTQKG